MPHVLVWYGRARRPSEADGVRIVALLSQERHPVLRPAPGPVVRAMDEHQGRQLLKIAVTDKDGSGQSGWVTSPLKTYPRAAGC